MSHIQIFKSISLSRHVFYKVKKYARWRKKIFITNCNETYLFIKCFILLKVLIPVNKARECDDIISRSGISVILFNDQRNDVPLINSLALLAGRRTR